MDVTALYTLSSGLYLLGVKLGEKANGCIINTAMQVTATPLQITVTVNKENLSCDMIHKAGYFSVSVLDNDVPMSTIAVFGFTSGKDRDKFSGIPYKLDSNGMPYLAENVTAVISARVVSSHDVGTHTIFVGEVTDAVNLRNTEPLTYSNYYKVKKGITPPKASSYLSVESKSASWQCTVCGYIYEGDPLPEDFICPVCGATADQFVKI